MRAKLIVNAANGYVFTPMYYDSVAAAVRAGKDYPGFYFRVYYTGKDGKIRTRKGYCD